MSRLDCLSNRNIKIIATYVTHKRGSCHALFEGLPYPTKDYSSPDDFFMNEDEWTTFDNFNKIFRRAKALVNETDFYFNCGASSARLRSWGRYHRFVGIFATPNDGFKRLPFFNKNFDDTKEIKIVLPPTYDHNFKKIRTVISIEPHTDSDPNRDFMGDHFTRGILSSIPTIWGLAPAVIRAILSPYNPEILLNEDPEFVPYGLDVRVQGDLMSLKDPVHGQRRTVGQKILLEPEIVNGQKVFLGKYTKQQSSNHSRGDGDTREAILITQSIQADNRILFTAGEILMAPYFILDITYDRVSLLQRLNQFFRIRSRHEDSGAELTETINQLRKNASSKNRAYQDLEETNTKLVEAKARLDEYARKLEQRVEERTTELRKAQQNLLQLNRNLEAKVEAQVIELQRYNELRRYLSPQLTEKILTSGHSFGTKPQRKMMTVVFTDIRGFSRLTDSLEPEEIFHLLDQYLSEMIKIIHDQDGTLNKIVGDGLLVFFGDPVPMEDHTERAVRMAIDMQKKVVDLRDDWRHYGHELGVGMGINTGFMTVGNIGSDTHKDYTVIGNQVNVSARLESMAKAGEILVSQRVYSKVKNLAEFEDAGETKIKGMHNPLKTYRIIW